MLLFIMIDGVNIRTQFRMEEKYVWENPIREEKIERYKPASMAVQQASDPMPDYLNLLPGL